ncbi:uncharacterized protein BDV14DRAFT_198264 [Aspergillus stella-maris]|uniref:uncharacterized protein n=1 Tax=Aspergillus stella-maris TaxID=1810926 RepID=UPI003CCDEB70
MAISATEARTAANGRTVTIVAVTLAALLELEEVARVRRVGGCCGDEGAGGEEEGENWCDGELPGWRRRMLS